MVQKNVLERVADRHGGLIFRNRFHKRISALKFFRSRLILCNKRRKNRWERPTISFLLVLVKLLVTVLRRVEANAAFPEAQPK
jgi:hypothetical protein